MIKNTKWKGGTIKRYAGTGIAGYRGDGERADMAQLNGPAGLAFDNLAYTIAGNGEQGCSDCTRSRVISRISNHLSINGTVSCVFPGLQRLFI